jgi:hypothetical protein
VSVDIAEFVNLPAAAFQESSAAGATPALPLSAALALREHDVIERVTIATTHHWVTIMMTMIWNELAQRGRAVRVIGSAILFSARDGESKQLGIRGNTGF